MTQNLGINELRDLLIKDPNAFWALARKEGARLAILAAIDEVSAIMDGSGVERNPLVDRQLDLHESSASNEDAYDALVEMLEEHKNTLDLLNKTLKETANLEEIAAVVPLRLSKENGLDQLQVGLSARPSAGVATRFKRRSKISGIPWKRMRCCQENNMTNKTQLQRMLDTDPNLFWEDIERVGFSEIHLQIMDEESERCARQRGFEQIHESVSGLRTEKVEHTKQIGEIKDVLLAINANMARIDGNLSRIDHNMATMRATLAVSPQQLKHKGRTSR